MGSFSLAWRSARMGKDLRRNAARGKSPAAVRCAIYTRKSTEEGLDQDFNSLHAQREAAEAYIKSQKQLGWTLVVNQYNDGGFSGGSLDRPALQKLLEDVEARRLDCVVVYKVDRLSRSLLDFARLMDRDARVFGPYKRRPRSFCRPNDTSSTLHTRESGDDLCF